jgi:hypothetical protein
MNSSWAFDIAFFFFLVALTCSCLFESSKGHRAENVRRHFIWLLGKKLCLNGCVSCVMQLKAVESTKFKI